MKNTIITEIHRQRATYAKRFNHDVDAIGNDIRRSEVESGGKYVRLDAKTGRYVEVKRSKTNHTTPLPAHD